MTPNPYDYSRGGGRPARLSKLTGTWFKELNDLWAMLSELSGWEQQYVMSILQQADWSKSASPKVAAKIAEIWDAKCGEKDPQ